MGNLQNLIVGSSEGIDNAVHISWNQEFPTIIDYNYIVVIPEKGTDEKQELVIRQLKDDLKLLQKFDGCIVWVLNEHTTPKIAEELGLGKLVSLRNLKDGQINSFIEHVDFKIASIHYGFTEKTWNSIEIVNYQTPVKNVKISVGMSSAENTWMLIPPPENYNRLISNEHKNKVGAKKKTTLISTFIWLLLLIFITSSSDIDRKRMVTVSKYSNMGTIRKLPLPYPEDLLDSVWLTPQKRLAARILSKNRDQFAELAKHLQPRESALELWERKSQIEWSYETYREDWTEDGYRKNTKQTVRIDDTRYFEYALLTGDLNSAITIVGQASAREEGWIKVVTETIWQLTLESLHELDLEAAQVYNEVYIHMIDQLTKQARLDSYLLAQKIRTLSRILQRELNSSRKVSFLKYPGVKNSFGRFSENSWEYPLPATDPQGLAERRAANLTKYADLLNSAGPVVIYDSLRTLQNIRRFPEKYAGIDPQTLEVGRFAALECEYLLLKNEVLSGVDQATFRKVVTFSNQDNYLWDDLLNVTLTEIYYRGRAHSQPGCIELPQLVTLLRKLENSSADSKGIIELKLGRMNAQWISYQPIQLNELYNESRYVQDRIIRMLRL